jgi:ribosomal protein L37AE/L43A
LSVIADIFRNEGGAYRDRFGDRMLPSHRRAMRDIEQCRTPARGGHLYLCDDCQKTESAYHSCRNRHCPTCQGDRAEQWAQAQKERILPTDYYLITFTVPDSLRPLARSNQRCLYDLLLRCAAKTIQKLAKDPKYLGAQPGMIGVLHTWTRDLHFHPHAHFLVSAGGLTAGGRGWRKPKNSDFLMPGRVLSPIFRAKLRDALRDADLYDTVPEKAWKQDWVVHVKRAGTGEEMTGYLSRYLFRPPISNQSIERYEAGNVTFRYRDGKTGELRRSHVTSEEFIRRFLQHVLPRGFTRVRHYGCFSPGSAKKLALARRLLEGMQGTAPLAEEDSRIPAQPDDVKLDAPERDLEHRIDPEDSQEEKATDPSERRCPFCKKATMRRIAEIPRPPRRHRSSLRTQRAPP